MLVLIASGAGPFTHHGLLECLSDEVELTRLTMFLEREHATSQGHPYKQTKWETALRRAVLPLAPVLTVSLGTILLASPLLAAS
jgi:hypothetical protein